MSIGLLRLLAILRVAMTYRLDTFLQGRRLPWGLRIALVFWPARWLGEPSAPRGERLRRALEALGPVFVKFGQALSTRRDLIPPDIADELAKLQDTVAPFPAEQSIAIIEHALGQPVDTLFKRFDRTPMASASVAQVHSAQLPDGREAVVKVIRPGIDTVIEQDIALLRLLARALERFHPDGKRLNPRVVVEDYRLTILDELDLLREAANTSQLRRNFASGELLYVPEVYWDWTRQTVLTLERIHGIPISDIARLIERGVDMEKLAERGVQIFFTQVFRHNFFHADMHPGNIFVDATDPSNPRYIGIDCAIIGTLSEADQYYLARNLLAIFHRDYRLVAELHVECGWVPPDTAVGAFESAIRSVCEPIFEKPLGEISFAQLLVYLFQTARRFNMEVQPSLVLLQKTLLHIEGLGRDLYPELDLWATAQPFLEDWLRQRYSPAHIAERLKRQAPGWLEQLPLLPGRIMAALDAVSDSAESLREQQAREIQRWQQEARWHRRLWLVLVLGLVIGSLWVTGLLPAMP
ncbi:MAG: ubiquinone biosynthesis regulatory protein kinase UbiB [Gammaproteobacteria bacterium]|nr:MAG: ubiquinone biosynthesis regulatory protein kinase UbiB [Gammaproteobacteria bacterium]